VAENAATDAPAVSEAADLAATMFFLPCPNPMQRARAQAGRLGKEASITRRRFPNTRLGRLTVRFVRSHTLKCCSREAQDDSLIIEINSTVREARFFTPRLLPPSLDSNLIFSALYFHLVWCFIVLPLIVFVYFAGLGPCRPWVETRVLGF
jgi:hypothetical protein